MKKGKKRRQLTNKRKRFLITNAFLALFLFIGIGYSALDANLNIFGNIQLKKYERNTLYNVLKNEALSGGLAREYTGEHQDSIDASLSKQKIYHWYAENDTDGTAVLDKNNVIFANHCWQMIRTTDTGGVKMMYNGEVEDGKCLDTRSNHEGFDNPAIYDLSNSYWYGTNYVYDKSINKYRLSGELENLTWNSSTYDNIIGKYTCLSSTSDSTCSELVLALDYYNETKAKILTFSSPVNYSICGEVNYNFVSSSPGYVGYMYNKIYPQSKKTILEKSNMLESYSISSSSTYYYGTGISYDESTNKYSLLGKSSGKWSDIYTSASGLYTCKLTTDSDCSSVYYIVGAKSYEITGFEIKDGNNIDDYDTNINVSTSYYENNGTYIMNDPTVLKKSEWYNDYSSYENNYICPDGNSSCSNIRYIKSVNNSNYSYLDISKNYIYANSFSYDGSQYTLDTTNSMQTYDLSLPANMSSLSNKKYTCFNTTGVCTNIYYIYGKTQSQLNYMELSNGDSISDAIENMLSANDVNRYDSTIKKAIDSWFKRSMINYQNMIEDTIFCNNRSISSLGGFDENGNNFNNLLFDEYNYSKDLSCKNNTDKFSLSNPNAQLTYPVGLATVPELNLLNNKEILKSATHHRTMSPYRYLNYNDYVTTTFINYSSGSFNETNVVTLYGVRPVISLKPNTEFSGGNGSKENPYVVETN